ncbi:MAG: 50S ribosomal protein L10 [Chlamydiales bacterium]|nr:50S ribosomal protein L10 [Chlamydiales bacterium]
MRQEKNLLLDQIKHHLKTNAYIVLSNKGLNANNEADLRSEVAKCGGRLLTLKKRMLIKAAEHSGVSISKQQLNGQITVLSMSENIVETIKTLFKFKEEKENMLDVLMGQYEGALCTPQDIEQISKLPSKDEMRAELLGVFEAVQASTLGTMEALLTSVLYCLENKNNQQEAS